MKKLAVLAAVSLLTLTGVAAVAQPAPGQAPASPPAAATPSTPAPAEARSQRGPTAADLRAIVDARIAGVPAGLKLTPEQQRLWAPVEQALRAQANERIEAIEARRNPAPRTQDAQQQQGDLVQRLEERARRVTDRAQRLQSFASAMRPFWDSLNEDQKRVLPVLIRPRPIAGFGFERRDDDRDRRGGRERAEGRGGEPRGMMERHRDHHGDRDEHYRGRGEWREGRGMMMDHDRQRYGGRGMDHGGGHR